MVKSKWSSELESIPATEHRPEIIFRVSSDDGIFVEYGRDQSMDYMAAFRVMAVTLELERRITSGWLSTIGILEVQPCSKVYIVRYDIRKISVNKVIEVIKDAEMSVGDSRDVAKLSFSSPIFEMPVCFDDRYVKEAVELYIKLFKNPKQRTELPSPGYPDYDPISLSCLPYLCLYNGISEDQFKEKFLGTEWLSMYSGFLLGLQLFFPVDRRSLIRTSKSNPARTWTKRGTLGFGGSDFSWYPVDGAGGYHLFGRTSPQMQLDQKHPSFKMDISLVHPGDRVRFYEVDETELLRIEKLVDEGSSEFIYKKTPARFSIEEFLEFDNGNKEEIEAWYKHQDEAASKVPMP